MSLDFDRPYKLWAYFHSAFLFLVAFLMSPVFTLEPSFFFWGLAPYAILSLIWLYSLQGWQSLGGADLLTASRGVGAALLFLWGALRPEVSALGSEIGRWALLGFLVAVEATDFFDGRVARRSGPRPFGAVWDMENDALYILALSMVGFVHLGFPVWTLLLGLMRYLYFLLFRVTGDPPRRPEQYKWFAKSVAAIIAISLITSYAPMLGSLSISILLATVLSLQLISFGWDVYLQARGGKIRLGLFKEEELPRKMETWR